ncbi:hypothetical protein K504DRAFT_116409 [Pleomassaria siparia CBS 279.74]|uniref:Uncharacterized protein n=1 Tax=Pleomassaria siparia CBS 279.74 TaxID=1314801 RepID=A0A6G1JW24_9PLEO|nr:hypothetical protein K504DRAFT_116409 [Pleomassaria siparia CBS 279.74]
MGWLGSILNGKIAKQCLESRMRCLRRCALSTGKRKSTDEPTRNHPKSNPQTSPRHFLPPFLGGLSSMRRDNAITIIAWRARAMCIDCSVRGARNFIPGLIATTGIMWGLIIWGRSLSHFFPASCFHVR